MSQGYKNKFGTDYRVEYFEHHKGVAGVYMCAYCGKLLPKDAVTVDHVIPKSKFFGNIIWNANKKTNLVCACKHCNSSKGAKVDLRILQGVLTLLLGPIGTIVGLIAKVFYNIAAFFTRVGIIGVSKKILKAVFRAVNRVPLAAKVVIIAGCVYYLGYLGIIDLDVLGAKLKEWAAIAIQSVENIF